MSFLDLDERLIELADKMDLVYSPIADVKEFPEGVDVTLVEGAIANVQAKGTTDGLTGPIRRGDAPTIQRHFEALRGKPELAEIYRVLARRALEIATRIDGPDAPDRKGLDAIRALIDSD